MMYPNVQNQNVDTLWHSDKFRSYGKNHSRKYMGKHAPLKWRVHTNNKAKLIFTPNQNLGAGNIYPAQEIRTTQDAMLFKHERKAINNILMHKTMGQGIDNQDVSMLHIFSAE